VPIIGQGGICSADDALEFLIAGATTVGVGTALFYEPHSCKRINDGIAAYLAAHRMASIRALIGSLDAPKRTVQACAC
jgi:dihydroorotate dehydrogenase (NAD+) catalytic subunit